MNRASESVPRSVCYVLTILVVHFIGRIIVLLVADNADLPAATKHAQVVLDALGLILPILLIRGIAKGHRLAWQWGRIIVPVFGTAILLAGIAMIPVTISRAPSVAELLGGMALGLWSITFGVLWLGIFFALGRDSALRWFDLYCPRCGKRTNRAADFFFTRARCRECQLVWRSSAVYRAKTAGTWTPSPPRRLPGIVFFMVLILLLSLAMNALVFAASFSSPSGPSANWAVLLLASLLIWGMFAGSRPVWYWGRFIVPLGAIGLIGYGIAKIFAISWSNGHSLFVVFTTFLDAGFAAAITLGFFFPSARKHFDLICPNCANSRPRTTNWLCSEMRCTQCDHRWQSSEAERSNSSATPQIGSPILDAVAADEPALPHQPRKT